MSPLAWGLWESLGLLGRLVTYVRFRGFVVIKWVGVGWGGVVWRLTYVMSFVVAF